MKKDNHKPMNAADMGRKRWAGVSKAKRTELAKQAVQAREEKRRLEKKLIERLTSNAR